MSELDSGSVSPLRHRANRGVNSPLATSDSKGGNRHHVLELASARDEVKADSPASTHDEGRGGKAQRPQSVGFFKDTETGGPVSNVIPPPKGLFDKRASSILATGGATLLFHKLVLTARYFGKGMKPRTKRILKGISGVARKGTMTALMGPSGCGKTSLLHTLAGKNSQAQVSGHLLVDGRPRSEGFQAKIGYVEQDDMLMGILTVRENLMFSANLRLPSSISKMEKEERVEDTIDAMGLWKCANSKIGTELIRGVSGGERKRTSIGMELVVDPAVLFLDEPTSGLDAFTAQAVVEILHDLAQQGKTIVLSIHQPRYTVFKLFDCLMLLAEGEMVYQGKPEAGVGYFAGIGFQCEAFNNPSDFFMDVVCQQIRRLERTMSLGGTVTIQEGGYLAKEFLKSTPGQAVIQECDNAITKLGVAVGTEKHHPGKHIRTYATGFWHQLAVISKRCIICVMRNPATSVLQILAFSASAFIVGAFYHGKLNDGPSGLEDRVGALFMISYMVIFGQLTSIETFIQERALFIHEKTSGFYRTSAYFLAKALCEIVPTRIFPTLAYAIISAFMMGLRTDAYHFLMYWLTLTVTNLASTSLCLAVSSAVPVYSVGFMVAALMNVFFMISSGFLLNANSISGWLIPFKYLSMFRYNLNALMILELKDRKFNCPNLMEVVQGVVKPTICVPDGNFYLEVKNVESSRLWRYILALAVMTPAYLLIAYICLRRLKKGG